MHSAYKLCSVYYSLTYCTRLASARVTRLITSDGLACEVTGVGYNGNGSVFCNNEVVTDHSHPSVRKMVEVCLHACFQMH